MANDEAYADTVFSRFVAEHEIAHTYFPFYMGINESRYAFMDEGWATTFEFLIGEADLGHDKAATFFQQFRVASWAADPSPLEDLPIITPADVLKDAAYGNNAYGKPALGYLALKELLGDALFRKGLHEFMSRWHGKHPIPWDMFNTFNDATGRNLNWFWQNWYFTNGYIDLALTSAKKTSAGYSLTIDNVGGLAAPVDVVFVSVFFAVATAARARYHFGWRRSSVPRVCQQQVEVCRRGRPARRFAAAADTLAPGRPATRTPRLVLPKPLPLEFRRRSPSADWCFVPRWPPPRVRRRGRTTTRRALISIS